MAVVGRFAPSPTGLLHLGNLRTALASWLSARSQGGSWILRMEDVDGPRCRRDWGEAQLRQLAALGMESDVPVLWQSERRPIYDAALARLRAEGRLYPCRCSRKDLALLASAPHAEDGLRPYPGTCRHRTWEEPDASAWRFRLKPGSLAWDDRCSGPQTDDPSSLTGDPVLFRRDGCVAYHLAVVVDDGDQGVTEVVRGADLRSVTATQIQLQEALGLPRPDYAHVSLVQAPSGVRLGKRHNDRTPEALFGNNAAALLGWLGWSLGCLDQPESCRLEDLVSRFRWPSLPRNPVLAP